VHRHAEARPGCPDQHIGVDTSAVAGSWHRSGFDAVTALLLLELAREFAALAALAAVAVPPGLPGSPEVTASGPAAQVPLW
jgi:hypothetical protein